MEISPHPLNLNQRRGSLINMVTGPDLWFSILRFSRVTKGNMEQVCVFMSCGLDFLIMKNFNVFGCIKKRSNSQISTSYILISQSKQTFFSKGSRLEWRPKGLMRLRFKPSDFEIRRLRPIVGIFQTVKYAQ
ncbi:hypothetical protein VP01_1245g4 [Puccinia sorghi]|uniref:Uncharacterized protein n=1 Tax=Puccinia sorghi TaxID=27349 RepID=A0A0L6VPJ8_9BASI|nr:hypothetical protein VP01_1245g4 [Puccinia sorghi]